MKTDLRLTDTNAASDSRGRTWGLEGSLFWWLVGGIGAAITAFFLLLVVLKITLGVSLGIALVPLALCLAYIFGLRQGKPPGALLQNGFWIKVDNAVPASITPACQLTERKRRKLFGDPPKFPTGWGGKLPVYIRCMPTGYVQTKGPPPRPGRPIGA